MDRWDEKTVRCVISCSKQLSDWVNQNPQLRTELYCADIDHGIVDFPFTENLFVEYQLVGRTVRRINDFESYSFDEDAPNSQYRCSHSIITVHDIYDTIVEMLFNTIEHLWEDKINLSNFDTTCYPDHLMRNAVLRPPGYGVGYLCLGIARDVNMDDIMLINLIDEAHYLSQLPFTREEQKALTHITGSTNRLRLALLLIHELGRACTLTNVYLGTRNFHMNIRTLFSYMSVYDCPVFLESVIASKLPS